MAYRDALGEQVEAVSDYRVGRRCVYPRARSQDRARRTGGRGASACGRFLRSWIGADQLDPVLGRPASRHRRISTPGASRACGGGSDGEARASSRECSPRPSIRRGTSWSPVRPRARSTARPEYLDALCEAAGGSFRILAVRRRATSFSEESPSTSGSSRSGAYVSPRLLLYYNGIVLRPYETRYPSQRTSRQNEILESLLDGLAGLNYGRVSLRCRSPLTDVRVLLARGWTARPQYSYVVPLTDMDALWGRMEQNLRRLVDRCAAQGLSVTEDDDFESFFRLHSQIHERKGASLYLPKAGLPALLRAAARARPRPPLPRPAARRRVGLDPARPPRFPPGVAHRQRGRRRGAPEARRHGVSPLERLPAAFRAGRRRRTI